MRRKVFGIITIVVIAAIAGYNVYTAQKRDVKLSKLELANVEALATSEIQQPNVDDCVSSPDSKCGALHPTDSSKDQIRYEARWD